MTKKSDSKVCKDFAALKDEGLGDSEAILQIAELNDQSVGDIKIILRERGLIRDYSGLIVGGAVAALSSLLLLYMCSPRSRPEIGELAIQNYASQCGKKYDENCKGKFIIWEGSVESIESSYVRVQIKNDLAVDVQDVGNKQAELTDGQRVKITGWLADDNIVHPDVSKGEIVSLESLEIAKNRFAKQERQEEANAEAELREWSKKPNPDAVCDILSMGNDSAASNCKNKIAGGRSDSIYSDAKEEAINSAIGQCAPFANNSSVYDECVKNVRRSAKTW
jgi:hypothetical protein